MPSHVHLLTSDRPIEWITHRGVTVLWAIFASVWLYLACLPIEISSQAWLAYGSLLILILLRRVAQRYRLLRLTFLVIASFLTARYFVWRVTETLGYNGPFSFIAALLLFIAELYSITVYFLGIFVNLSPLRRQSVPLPKDPDRLPTVDVYIPSYNEDPELLETTLLGALNMRYPADKYKVYLLDDGGTDEQCNNPDPDKASAARARRARLQKLCADIGAHYLTRERNEHAKAGNLNAALKHTHGDLIVIFDADHTPTVDFLERTVGPFVANPRLFLVQTPHFFISPDPVERNLKLFSYMPGENEMFYDVIQHGLDFWEASFFCGSAAILRRKALEEAGGFACSTVTEDAETALSLHALGWQSAYINHPMVAGLQPETYTGFITQRMRWAQGMLQVLLFKNPLRQKGLALWQRLAYFNSIFFWFFPFARAVFLLAPSFFLIFGLQIYDANLKNFLAYAMPHLLAVVMVADLLFGRVRWAFISELYEMAQFFYSLGAIVRILRNPRTVSFAVTPKGERLDEEFITSLARPFYVFLMITSISIGMGVWRLIYQPQQLNATLITLGWEVFNGVLLCGVIGAMVEQRQRRKAPRMPAFDRASLVSSAAEPVPVRIKDISATGVQLDLDSSADMKKKECLELLVHIECLGQEARLPVRLQWQRGSAAGFAFCPRTIAERRNVVALAYGDSMRWARFRRLRKERYEGILPSAGLLFRLGIIGIFSNLRVLAREGITYLRRNIIRRISWKTFLVS